jgi:hypothetical protein
MVAALRRAGVPAADAVRLVRFDEAHGRLEVAVETSERPPLASLAPRAGEMSA